jgi:hypothetical protein
MPHEVSGDQDASCGAPGTALQLEPLCSCARHGLFLHYVANCGGSRGRADAPHPAQECAGALSAPHFLELLI